MKFLNGQLQLDSSLTGTTALFTSGLTVGSGQTSSSGIARGQLLNSNLTASANNNVLVGIDINPTFTNGAFTGTENIHIRSISAVNETVVKNILLKNTGIGGGSGVSIGFNNLAGNNLSHAFIKSYYSSGMAISFGTGGGASLLSEGTVALVLNSDQTANFTGKVTVNSGGLQVVGISANMLMSDGSAPVITRNGSTGIQFLKDVYWQTFSVFTNNVENLRITGVGNILMGTTTDLGFKLSVSGSTLLRGSGTTSASYALATQNSSGGTTMVVNNAGNMLIGTTTDAGYKLDVNGTIRGQSGLWGGDVFLGNISGTRFIYLPSGYGLYIGSVGNVPTVLGDSIFSTTLNATINRFTLSHTLGSEQVTKLVGGSSVNHLNPFFDIVASVTSSPPKEIDMRIYTDYYSGTQRWGNIILGHNGNNTAGNILMGTNVGNGSRLLVGGTVSGATLSTTRAVHINPTLLATGNTTTLIGLDIQPTFTSGSFTGLTQLALRVSGGTQIIGSGSTGTTLSVFSVDGSSGRLFDVSDDLSSTLFSVNTIAGLPVIEAFANNAVVMGKYNQNTLVVSGTSVGIGTSSPQAKLDVSGTSIFRTGVTMNSSLILGNVDITSAWSAYTPTWTAISSNPSIGNGTITGTFKVIGKTCFVRGRITMGSSTTYGSGAWLIGLPLPAINSYAIQITSSLLNNGNAWYSGLMNGGRFGNTSYSEIQVQNTSGTADGISSTYPFTWGDTDELSFNGSYEIA